MKKQLFCLATLLFASTMAFSETNDDQSNSKQLYDNWSNINIQWNPSAMVPEKGSSKSFTGISIGLNSCSSFSRTNTSPFYGEFSIGFQYSFDSTDGADFSMYSGKMHIGVGYAIVIPDSPIAFMPHAGLGYYFHFSAKTEIGGKTIDHFDWKDMGGSEKTWDKMPIGWYAGLKMRISKKAIIDATYGYDFSEISKNVKVRTVSVTLGTSF